MKAVQGVLQNRGGLPEREKKSSAATMIGWVHDRARNGDGLDSGRQPSTVAVELSTINPKSACEVVSGWRKSARSEDDAVKSA